MKYDAIDEALRIVSEHFGVSVADMRSQRRTRHVHPARVWAAYLAVMTTDAGFAAIGRRFNRDHTVVRMYARACARAVADNQESAALYDDLKSRRMVG